MQQVDVMTSGPDTLFQVHDLRQQGERITGVMDTGPWASGPDGRPALGALGVLTDDVLGYAVMASLSPGSWSISTEIWIDLVGSMPAGGNLSAEARPLQPGSFSAGRVVDASGRLVAECRQRGRRVEAAGLNALGREARPSGAGNLCGVIGLRSSGPHHVLETTDALVNPSQMLHGGVSLAASELVATHSRLSSGSSLGTTSLHIVHARGVPIGARVDFEAVTRDAGRSLWVTDVTRTVEEKLCTTARITAQT